MDSLSHAFESLWNVHHNPISDTLAVAAARGILTNLPIVLEAQQAAEASAIGGGGGARRDDDDDDDRIRKARMELSAASLRAGIAFSNTETALAHAISFPITIEHGKSLGSPPSPQSALSSLSHTFITHRHQTRSCLFILITPSLGHVLGSQSRT